MCAFILGIFILCTFIYPKTTYEIFHKVRPHAIGNTLSSYFTLYLHRCKNNKPFIVNTNHKSSIIKNLPESLPLRKIDIDVNGLEKHIEESTLWEENFDVWKKLQPVVRQCIKKSLELSNIPRYECVIHFRCSDTPFNRHRSYHLLKYSWYYKAMNVALQYKSIQKIHILMCSSHRSHPLSYLCNNLVKDLQDFLHRIFGIPSIVICNSPDNDFSIMYNSHVLIAGGISSFSFFAGLASDNLFILPTFEREDENGPPAISCRENMVFIRKEFVKHNVVEYSHIDNILDRINGRGHNIKSLMPVIDTNKKSI